MRHDGPFGINSLLPNEPWRVLAAAFHLAGRLRQGAFTGLSGSVSAPGCTVGSRGQILASRSG